MIELLSRVPDRRKRQKKEILLIISIFTFVGLCQILAMILEFKGYMT